jgi:hypothetical protein
MGRLNPSFTETYEVECNDELPAGQATLRIDIDKEPDVFQLFLAELRFEEQRPSIVA